MRKRHRRRCRRGRNIGFGVNYLLSKYNKSISQTSLDGKVGKIYDVLPRLDCGSCGYESCLDMAKAIADGKENSNACVVAGDELAPKIERILGGDV